MANIEFFGAAGGVTGSKSLVTFGATRLLVDCGMFQGLKADRLKNWAPLGFDLQTLDAILVTHAHLDHAGALPLAAREGYRGPIYCTPGTAALLEILLEDSARLQEEEARYRNAKGWTKHKPALPLFTEEDARTALSLVKTVPYNQSFTIADVVCSFHPANHILGSAHVRLEGEGTSILFSGDIGRGDHLLFGEAQPRPAADTVICESTYGNRLHPGTEPIDELRDALAPVLRRKGVALLPAFAVGRAQELLVMLNMLIERGELPACPIVLDSPMANRAFEATEDHLKELTADGRQRLAGAGARTRFVMDGIESRSLNEMAGPAVIVSAAGMLTGGRVLHHLRFHAGKTNDALILCGYQAPGTRGRRIAEGDPNVKIHGQPIDLRLEIVQLRTFSAHADQEGLWIWLNQAPLPKRVFVNHGEPEAVATFVQLLKDRAPEVESQAAAMGRSFDLTVKAAGL